jgi:uncharacterized protein (DUF169 family)
MMIKKIYKNVPIPPKGQKSTVKQLLERMEEGDMVLVTKNQAQAMRNIAYKHGHKVVTRAASKNEVRVWKVS